MSVTSTTYTGVGGAYTIQGSELAYTTICRVQRSGVEYDVVTGTPGARQVKYEVNEGRLTFLNSFSGNPANDIGVEDIIVTYNV